MCYKFTLKPKSTLVPNQLQWHRMQVQTKHPDTYLEQLLESDSNLIGV